MKLNTRLLYEELPIQAQFTIDEFLADIIDNGCSVTFEVDNKTYEVYMCNTKSADNENYYTITEFI